MATTPENHQPVSEAGDAATQPNLYGAAPTAASVDVADAQTVPASQAPFVAPQQPFAEQPTTPLPGVMTAPQGGGVYAQQQAGSPAHAQQNHAPQQAEVQPAPSTTNYPQPTGNAYGAPTQQQPTQQFQQAQQFPSTQQSYPQPTQPSFGGNGGNDGSGNGSFSRTSESAQPKSRTGLLLAGLAIGALLGGVVGGGVAAVVSANNDQQVVSQTASGSLTLNNAETATEITGVAAVATPSVVTLEVVGASASGSGSGVVYTEDGYIITNAHVVTLDGAAGDNATVRVKMSDGRILDGKVVDVDPYADLAVVKVEAEGLTAIKVADSDKLNVGDLTVAIGAPLNLANTVTSGVVSSLYRGISVGSSLIPQEQATPDEGNGRGDSNGDEGYSSPWDFRFGLPDQQEESQQTQTTSGSVTLPVVQTDASINPGNSGGALLNGKGELIGINVAIASPTSSDGVAGSAGLGFAIPSNLAVRVADAIIAGEQPSHGLLGASVADSTQDTDADANHAGGLLVEIVQGGAADKAGLKAGDVVTAVNGVAATDGTSVSALVRMNAGGSTISIDYTRDGKAGQTEAKLGTLEW